MIHDIAPHTFDNQFDGNEHPSASSPVIIFSKNREILTKDEDSLSFPVYADVQDSLRQCCYLFRLDDTPYFLGSLDESAKIPDTLWRPWITIRDANPKELAFAAMTALHLHTWYSRSRYCGCCGSKARHGEKERVMICPSCGNMMFPKINPAIIVAVTDGEKLLLTHYAGRKGYFALIAGFIEIGEKAEECVAREVMEEVGLHIKNIRYYDSQPWGFDGNLMLAYTAELDDSHTITLDRHELRDAVWLKPEEIPDANEYSSLTREMISRFKNHRLFPAS